MEIKNNGTGIMETHGLPLTTKEEYLAYRADGQDLVSTSGEVVGTARLYMMNDFFFTESLLK